MECLERGHYRDFFLGLFGLFLPLPNSDAGFIHILGYIYLYISKLIYRIGDSSVSLLLLHYLPFQFCAASIVCVPLRFPAEIYINFLT